MTFRRKILIVLIIVFGMLLTYNSYIAPLFVRSYGQMGMGMHGRMWNMGYGVNNFVDFRIILLFALVIIFIFLYDIFALTNYSNTCKQCGTTLESDRWNICPICGTRLKNRKGGR